MYTSISCFRYIMSYSAQFCEKHNHPTNTVSLSKEKILLMLGTHASLPHASHSSFQAICLQFGDSSKDFFFCLVSVCFFGLDAMHALDWKLDNAIMSEIYYCCQKPRIFLLYFSLLHGNWDFLSSDWFSDTITFRYHYRGCTHMLCNPIFHQSQICK